MYIDERGNLKSYKEKIEERIEMCERNAGDAKIQTFRFLDRADLKPEQVIEAREPHLSAFPGDYDDD